MLVRGRPLRAEGEEASLVQVGCELDFSVLAGRETDGGVLQGTIPSTWIEEKGSTVQGDRQR